MESTIRSVFEAQGDLHKAYERHRNPGKLIPGLPTVVRVDGNAFHTFTKGLQRPFDARLKACMQETAVKLLKRFNADIAYVQSDEISLGWKQTPMDFEGSVAKLTTLTAGLASSQFMLSLTKHLPEKLDQTPIFDSRIMQYPTLELMVDYFVWRAKDAERNSLFSLTQAHFGKEVEFKGFSEKHDMLHSIGLNWNDCDTHFKRGTFFKKDKIQKELEATILEKIPEKHRPTGPVSRSIIKELELKPLLQESNLLEVLFG